MTNYGPHYLSDNDLQRMPFQAIGTNVLISERVNFVNIESISIGNNVRIDSDVTILATGYVVIGSYVHIGAQCYLAGKGGIRLEDFSGLSQGVCIYSGSDDYSGEYLTNPTVPIEYLNIKLAEVIVGRHVIVGARTVILPGCQLGDGCAVGSLSMVKSSLKPWTMYAGVPVREIKPRRRGILDLESYINS